MIRRRKNKRTTQAREMIQEMESWWTAMLKTDMHKWLFYRISSFGAWVKMDAAV